MMKRYAISFLFALSVAHLVLISSILGASSSSFEPSDDDQSTAKNLPSCPTRCLKKDKELSGIRIFYLIILHNERTLNDAVHLFRAIRDPRNTILIHIDAKAKHLATKKNQTTLLLHQEIEFCSCGSTVRIESIHSVKWSHWSMNLPTLWGMQLAVQEYSGQWDVFINLSGDNLPVYTTDTMATTLAQLPYNFVTSSSCETGLLPTNVYLFPSWWHKRAHYTNRDTEPDPVFEYTATRDGKQKRNQTIITHFGSQWMILQADFCEWLVRELERQDSLPSLYREYLITSEKLMTDETFIPSLIIHSDEFKDTLPKMDEQDRLLWKNGSVSDIKAVRYERMDEHMPTAFGYFWKDQRYDVPPSSLADKPRVWGPYFLGVYDLGNIRQSGALFIRKVSVHVDPNMIQLLPVDRTEHIPPIQWPMEVAIGEKIDWKKKLMEARAGKDKDGQVEEDLDEELYQVEEDTEEGDEGDDTGQEL